MTEMSGSHNGAWFAHPALARLVSPAMLISPRVVASSAWIEHTPFAAWIIEAMRPRRVVELGTHNGPSYFAFCQAIDAFGLNCEAYAIDTWQGDEHAGAYGEDVYQAVLRENAPYQRFSTLKRMRFEDAVGDFDNASIDLLHIDGLHTYEAVRADFETWSPKLSERAVVLFHDTQVAKDGFGVTRYWEEISVGRPAFEFYHCNGLGVLGVGAEQTEKMRALFELGKDPAAADAARQAFESLGARQRTRMQFGEINATPSRLSRLFKALRVVISRPGPSAALLSRYQKGSLAPRG